MAGGNAPIKYRPTSAKAAAISTAIAAAARLPRASTIASTPNVSPIQAPRERVVSTDQKMTTAINVMPSGARRCFQEMKEGLSRRGAALRADAHLAHR